MTFATMFFALIVLPTASPSRPAPEGAARPIMLDFTSASCGPCRMMKPALEQLIRQGYPIKPVDVARSPELAERYGITGVPAFVVIDPASGRELGRTEGYQPAENLAALYNKARAKVSRPARPQAVETEDVERDSDRDDDTAAANDAPDADPADREPAAVNPKPWETVVRIKVHGAGSIGFGSGTLIASNAKESLVLTCAHIFKLERGPQAAPSRFPRKITVDLFDGNLSGPRKNQVHYANETFDGEAVDYDFVRDVGLIRIRPGRKLPFARVVPPHWTPKARFGMITVGCSEGHDATAWNTMIVNPAFRGLAGHDAYEAIECMVAPKQGRSGGGLFTTDGYVAGVCDFAEPRGDHGLYASPRSIYHVLDRNNLMALYAPARNPNPNERLVADNGRGAPSAGSPRPGMIARGQSPGRDDPGGASLPPPEMVGVKMPVLVRGASRRGSWQPSASAPARTAELKMHPSVDPDPFASPEPTGSDHAAESEPETAPEPPAPAPRSIRGTWRAGRSPLPELAGAGAN